MRYPRRIWLVRGNHESMEQNRGMSAQGMNGFDGACAAEFGARHGEAAFRAFHAVFEWLPLAALIERSVLVLHGGIGDGNWTLADLEARGARRPLDDDAIARDALVANVLWSDPMREVWCVWARAFVRLTEFGSSHRPPTQRSATADDDHPR